MAPFAHSSPATIHHAPPGRGGGGSSRHLAYALYRPGATASAVAAAAASAAGASAAASATAANAHLFASSAHAAGSAAGPAASSAASSSGDVEYADWYPLVSGRTGEDVLTAETMQSGFALQAPGVRDETNTIASTAHQLRDKRARLREKLQEFAQVAPKKQRTTKPIPTLIVASKEHREEWLRQLAADTPLSELARAPPHGIRGTQLIDELAARHVCAVRAVWYLKLVGVHVDSGRPTFALRSKAWTDEARLYLDTCLNDMAACWRATTATAAVVASPMPAGGSIEAKLTRCGLELHSATPATVDRWSRSSSRWAYMAHLLQYAFHDGVINRVNLISWLVDSVVSAAALTSIQHGVKLMATLDLAVAFMSSVLLSRSHAQRLFNACRQAHERCATSVSLPFLSIGSPLLQPLLQRIMRHIASALPNTRTWFATPAEAQAWMAECRASDDAAGNDLIDFLPPTLQNKIRLDDEDATMEDVGDANSSTGASPGSPLTSVYSSLLRADSWLAFFPRAIDALEDLCTQTPDATLPVVDALPLDQFDPVDFIAATSATAPPQQTAAAVARFIRQIPHFESVALPLLLTWCIKGTSQHGRARVSIVFALLSSYFPSPSSLSSALLSFLLAFRPAHFGELCRLTQLYVALTVRHLFPYREFVQKLIVTGSISTSANHADTKIDLTDWPSLSRYYLLHLPVTPDAVDLKHAALRTQERHEARQRELVFLDLVWLFEVDARITTTTQPDALPPLHTEVELRRATVKRGAHWTPEDRRLHPSLWAVRCGGQSVISFPSLALRALAEQVPAPPSRRSASPVLPPPACNAAALLAALPMPIAHATLDRFIHALLVQGDVANPECRLDLATSYRCVLASVVALSTACELQLDHAINLRCHELTGCTDIVLAVETKPDASMDDGLGIAASATSGELCELIAPWNARSFAHLINRRFAESSAELAIFLNQLLEPCLVGIAGPEPSTPPRPSLTAVGYGSRMEVLRQLLPTASSTARDAVWMQVSQRFDRQLTDQVAVGNFVPASFVLSTLLQCEPSSQPNAFTLRILDQCSLLVLGALQLAKPPSAFFQHGLTLRLACLQPSFGLLLANWSTEYEHLLRLLLVTLVAKCSDEDALDEHGFFRSVLASAQRMMDEGGLESRVLSDLQSLLHTSTRAHGPISVQRMSLLARSFGGVNGSLGTDLLGPAFAPDPWLLIEGITSSPFIDHTYEHSRPHAK